MRSSATKLGCGTKLQPWVIEAPIGQQINVSLLEFGNKTPRTTKTSNCERYGTVTEKSAGKNTSICGRGQEQNIMVYKSHSYVIEVILDVANNDDSISDQSRIFIGFHGIIY